MGQGRTRKGKTSGLKIVYLNNTKREETVVTTKQVIYKHCLKLSPPPSLTIHMYIFIHAMDMSQYDTEYPIGLAMKALEINTILDKPRTHT